MIRILKRSATAIGLMAAMTCGCTAPDGEPQLDGKETIEGDRYRFEGTGSIDALTPEERVTYEGDRAYIQSLAEPDTPIRLNFADERQHRFALARMKIANKTARNAPELFRALEDRRSRHVAAGYGPGLHPLAFAQHKSGGVAPMHFISSTNMYTPTEMEARSITTFPGGTHYTYNDIGVFDDQGTPLASVAFVEEYSGGTAVAIAAFGDTTLTTSLDYLVDSYRIEDTALGFTDSYVFRPRPNRLRLTAPTIAAPVDVRKDDGVISICLNRTWTQDCDYDLTGTPQSIHVPLSGQVSIASPGFRFDANGIAARQAGTIVGGDIKLVLNNTGGGCDVRATTGALHTNMQEFWQSVTLDSFGRTLSWNMVGNGSAFFDDGCRQVQDRATLAMLLQLPAVHTNGHTALVPITLSTEVQDVAYRFQPIKITNSCLAEGTLVELADGSTKPIETIEAGDVVRNPYDRRSLTVVDMARGFETEEMVRIVDSDGRNLLLTEKHPVQTVAAGMRMAGDLRVGHFVKTADGPRPLVQVTRERYDGEVYNLKVGNSEEMSTLGEDQSVVYANGILVGDGKVQSKYESIEMSNARDLSDLPARWRTDYDNSANR